MKKNNLFLSLICSIVLTVALVTVTIASVLPKKNDKKPVNPSTNVSQNVGDINNEANDGTAQKPFVLYDAESFIQYVKANGGKLVPVMEAVQEPVMVEKLDADGNVVLDENGNAVLTEKLDENGKVVYQNKVDENGKVVYKEKLDENGKVVKEGCHFVLNNNIDFAGVDFAPLFNQDKPFIGNIDGKGFALKNISMNVTAENFVSNFAYQYDDKDGIPCIKSHIGVFGSIENATIENVSFEGLKISVADEVYALVADAITVGDKKVTTLEITVGAVAAMAKNSVVAANVEANIDAGSYSRYSNNSVDGYNSVGGVVAVANECKFKDSKVNVTIVADNGTNYRVGGVAGYLYNSSVEKLEINANVVAKNNNQVLYIGGVTGLGRAIAIVDSKVNLVVNGVGDRLNVSAVSQIDESKVTKVAGIATYLRANSEKENSAISNVYVNANVDMDAMFAGAVVDVLSTNKDYVNFDVYVEFVDVNVNANVNTLEAFGFARTLKFASITITENAYKLDVETGANYLVKLTGQIGLKNTDETCVASLFVKDMFDFNEVYFTVNGSSNAGALEAVHVVCSYKIASQAELVEYDPNPIFGKVANYGVVEII